MFASRSAAGRLLARALLTRLAGSPALLLALAPGGVPVAAQVSALLHHPVDVLLVRDLEVALVVEGGQTELDHAHAHERGLSDAELGALIEEHHREMRREALELRGNRPFPFVWGRTVVLVDDGATSARALDGAVRLVRALGAARVVLAAPVISPALLDGVAGIVDDLVYLETAEQATAAYGETARLRDVDLAVQLLRARLAA